MKKYKSKKSALDAARNARHKMGGKFCPVFQSKCKGDACMSFTPGNIWEATPLRYSQPTHPDKPWNAHPPGCQNAIVNGYIEMEMIQP